MTRWRNWYGWRAAGYAVDISVNLSARHFVGSELCGLDRRMPQRHARRTGRAGTGDHREQIRSPDPERATITLQEILPKASASPSTILAPAIRRYRN